jgi:hypothetical protein
MPRAWRALQALSGYYCSSTDTGPPHFSQEAVAFE